MANRDRRDTRIFDGCDGSWPGWRRPGRVSVCSTRGCGAGWVGLEAARMGARLSAFDPSPEMIRIAASNAESLGIEARFEVGFAEASPFEGPFDRIISSGVVSFAPDPDAYFDGLDRVLRRSGTLVVGDLNFRSRGMRRRRLKKPVLPLRELNALKREQAIVHLRRRGYRIERVGFYQLTRPVPQLMHLAEARLGGLGCASLLLLNRLAHFLDGITGSRAAHLFDSFFVKAVKHAPRLHNHR